MYNLELHLTWILLSESYWWLRYLDPSLIIALYFGCAIIVSSKTKLIVYTKDVYVYNDVYNDNKSSFPELLDKDKGVTINVKNERALAIEMFKVSNNYSNSLMSETFDKQNNVYDFRNPSDFARRNVRSVIKSISFLGPKIWDIVRSELKQLETVNVFKREIKNWKPVNCHCRLCRPYIQNVGFS